MSRLVVESEVDESTTMAMRMDFLSNLPDDLIHIIISFLPNKDAPKLTVLSKRFRFVLYALPNIVYKLDSIRSVRIIVHEQRNKLRPRNLLYSNYFLDSLSRSIIHRRRVRCMINLEKFVFEVCLVDKFQDEQVESVNILNSAIVFAVEHNVKEFVLNCNVEFYFHCCLSKCFGAFPRNPYVVPNHIFTSASIRVLKLKFVAIDSSISNSMVKLEELSIGSCKLAEEFEISGCSIQSLQLISNYGCKKINVKASNLKTLYYKNKEFKYEIDYTSCKNLRRLTLKQDDKSEEWFSNHLAGFPLLEDLYLTTPTDGFMHRTLRRS